MQDTLHNTGAGYEYDFIWLYTGYCIFLYSEWIQHGDNSWCDCRGYKSANLHLTC